MKVYHVMFVILWIQSLTLSGQCTYTTANAGDYFAPENWVGGLQPPNPIPNGVVVTLNHPMTCGGVIENNGTLNGTTITILAGGSYGGYGVCNGTIINQGRLSPGTFAPGTLVNVLAGLTTTAATDILANTAISGGDICHDGGSAVTARGVCYGLNPFPDINGLHTNDGSGTGAFMSNLTGLSAGSTYYVRAYATNAAGTAYGQQESFVTLVSGFTCGDLLSYGGKDYATLQLGGQCWMAENLNIGTMISGVTSQTNNGIVEKYCYGDNMANCAIYGGLYQWNEMMQYTTTEGAQGICPSGWHLPSFTEWIILEGVLPSPDKGSRLAGNAGLWTDGVLDSSPDFGTSGFVALPGGLRSTNGSFFNLNGFANFWSSSELGGFPGNGGLFFFSADLGLGTGNKALEYSVRCVMD
ncbi:MAG: hypothetical protein IPJ54_12305 [Saprospiraceae bacterium]|nr:hypothetical protein [Saprospiraceae bacterium]